MFFHLVKLYNSFNLFTGGITMLNIETKPIFIYMYENGELFGVEEEMKNYSYILASIDDVRRDAEDEEDMEPWGNTIILKEGNFKWDATKKDYVKI